MNVLTEADLRASRQWKPDGEYHVEKHTFVTPTAWEFLREHQISLVFDSPAYASMTQSEIKDQGMYRYIDAATGAGYHTKPEEMTHLRENILVPKIHPRILLRGKLDELQAMILLIQVHCKGELLLCRDLESVLEFVQGILRAEVLEKSLGDLSLFGLKQEELRRMSHRVKEEFGMDHPIPDCRMGETALLLNLLRTQVRKAELAAAAAFSEGDCLQIIKNMNRLSSGIYILYCRRLSGYYEGKGGGERDGQAAGTGDCSSCS